MNNVHYRHFRDNLLNNDYTLCGLVNAGGNLAVGLAVRSPKDPFVKATGRHVSLEHAYATPIAELVIRDGQYSGHVFHEFVNSFTPNATFLAKINLGENVIVYN